MHQNDIEDRTILVVVISLSFFFFFKKNVKQDAAVTVFISVFISFALSLFFFALSQTYWTEYK